MQNVARKNDTWRKNARVIKHISHNLRWMHAASCLRYNRELSSCIRWQVSREIYKKPELQEVNNMENKDLEMLRDPLEWPQFPILPVKKRGGANGLDDLGVIIASDRTTVFKMNMFEFDEKNIHNGKELRESDVPRVEYNDEESLIAEWRVD